MTIFYIYQARHYKTPNGTGFLVRSRYFTMLERHWPHLSQTYQPKISICYARAVTCKGEKKKTNHTPSNQNYKELRVEKN